MTIRSVALETERFRTAAILRQPASSISTVPTALISLSRRSVGFDTVAFGVVGFALYVSVYLVPACFNQAQAYRVEQAGVVLTVALVGAAALTPSISSIVSDLCSVVCAAFFALAIAKRERIHPNVLTQFASNSLHVAGERLAKLNDYCMAHSIPYVVEARHHTMIALGDLIRQQALVPGLGDALAITSLVLTLAAVCGALTRKA